MGKFRGPNVHGNPAHPSTSRASQRQALFPCSERLCEHGFSSVGNRDRPYRAVGGFGIGATFRNGTKNRVCCHLRVVLLVHIFLPHCCGFDALGRNGLSNAFQAIIHFGITNCPHLGENQTGEKGNSTSGFQCRLGGVRIALTPRTNAMANASSNVTSLSWTT